MLYLDLLFFIVIVCSFLIFIIEDTNHVSDSFYLKEYVDLINLMNKCDITNDFLCYKELQKKYSYCIYIDKKLVFNNGCYDPKIRIKRIYYNKVVEIFGC